MLVKTHIVTVSYKHYVSTISIEKTKKINSPIKQSLYYERPTTTFLKAYNSPINTSIIIIVLPITICSERRKKERNKRRKKL